MANNSRDIEKGSEQYHEDAKGFRPPVQLTPEQYEQLFLQPGGRASIGTLSQRLGNPTPLAILAYLLCLTPTACFLMGWGGSDATSMVTMVGAYYFVGGLIMVTAGVMEWVLGNTFPFVIFVSFGGFWLGFGLLQDPSHSLASAFTDGSSSVQFNKGLMFYLAFWSVAGVIFFVASLRTNIVFAVILFTFTMVVTFLSVGYGYLGNGDVEFATTIFTTAGAFAWVNACIAWYLEFSLIMAVVEMPFTVPLGDLSGFLVKVKTS
ncbi:hypothetical protein D9758_014280 [Tetrapyrgos nigripes]|uniref:Uncharacterized protein n=1 Tax=Tetrapyrgos nigripes TaxID=182062 RepID=A0A8H5C412_9AGAR|nr:hypothetical protein D9758_014280 [Tetrapyrgos nigripes]